MFSDSLPRRRASRYRELLGISGNPFPDTAVASQDSMATFDPEVHPDLPGKMAHVFLGSNARRAPKVTLLWSLGAGPEARGYGKSAYLMWMAETVNADFGASFLTMCGVSPSPSDRVVGVYTSFSTVEALSLSGVLHAASRDFLARNEPIISRLRAERQASGHSEADLARSAMEIARRATDGFEPTLVVSLLFDASIKWRDVLANHRLWHQQRWGRRVFASLTAVLKALGISRILLLIDQLEDFAEGWGPLSKHYRDFGRLASMCVDDPLFSDCLQVVLTMHPRAQFITECCWNPAKLGPFPSLEDENRCLIIRGLTPDGLVRLTRRYLTQVRVAELDGTEPFTMAALKRLCVLAKGRPGSAIRALHIAIEDAVDSGSRVIDARQIEEACQ